MSSILAVFNRRDLPLEKSNLEAMMVVRPERGPDGVHTQIDGSIGLGHQHFWVTPEEWGEQQPLDDGSCLLSCDARLDNRPQLARGLGFDASQSRSLSDAQLILLSYRKWGLSCLSHMLGDYGFVLWDRCERRLFFARDALGARDICYYLDEGRCLVASEISQILAHPEVQARLNENAVAAFLANLWDNSEETYYRDIYYLPPGHGMVVTKDQTQMWRYWDIDPETTITYKDEQQYVDHYLELLMGATRCRLRSVGPVALSLSGGLDSTALAAISAPMMAETVSGQDRLLTFSYVFDELQSCDERRFFQPVIDRYQLEATCLPCDDKWPLKNLSDWPVSRDDIIADAYAWLPETVREAAGKRGVRTLLAGYFGDALSGGGSYWALDMIRHLRLDLLARTVLENSPRIRWRQDIVNNGLRQLLPRKVVRAYRNSRPRALAPIAPGIHPNFIARTDVRQRHGLISHREEFSAPGQWHRYRSLMLSVFSRVGSVRYLYNRHGLELEQPYFDRRLVEFAMAVPAYILGRPGGYRRLQRKSMEGLLPKAVLERERGTIFTPLLSKGLEIEERKTVKRILTDPLIVRREFIDAEWLRAQLERKHDLSAGSFLLWNALCVELWLQRFWK